MTRHDGIPRQPKSFPIGEAMEFLRAAVRAFPNDSMSVAASAAGGIDPFRVLIGTILSLRTRDAQTAPACRRLFARADTPQAMLAVPETDLAQLIYPVGFYNAKARTIREVCRLLLERQDGKVPAAMEELLALPGVGRKTANLVITLGFGLPGICVDTHVHRICNRWGFIRTATPDETEARLRAKLPSEYWIPINEWMVLFGQNICTPQSPRCSGCALAEGACRRVGVGRSR